MRGIENGEKTFTDVDQEETASGYSAKDIYWGPMKALRSKILVHGQVEEGSLNDSVPVLLQIYTLEFSIHMAYFSNCMYMSRSLDLIRFSK